MSFHRHPPFAHQARRGVRGAHCRFALLPLLSMCFLGDAAGQPAAKKPPVQATIPSETGGPEHHKNFIADARKKQYRVVFFGDSATQGWGTTGREIWQAKFAPLNSGFFGAGNQPVGHLLWRLQNGLLDGYQPKVVVLSIGNANTMNGCSGTEVAAGIKECLAEVQKRQPQAKVILMALAAVPFPGAVSEVAAAQGRACNQILAKLDEGKTMRLIDLNPELLANVEAIQKELAKVKDPHKLTLGYEIWAQALGKPLQAMLK